VLVTTLVLIDLYFYLSGRILPNEVYPDILWNKVIDRTAMYLFLPLITILVFYREKPAEYGFQPGDWRRGLMFTLVAWLVAAPVLFFATQGSDMHAYYLIRYGSLSFGEKVLIVALDLFGWEFMFRGFLLVALYRVMGPIAIVVQALPFVMGHIGKPAIETLSTIFGGTFFGWIGWRTRSFYYPFLIHYGILLMTVLFALR